MASACNQPDNSQGQEEKMSAVVLALAYKDQGYHEMEFTTDDGYESYDTHLQKEKTCMKNPGHPTFIKATQFTIEHLPECWRDSLVFNYITAWIGLTVRLAVKYTSKSRPPNYPLYTRRGQYGVTAYASGWVRKVVRKFTEKDGRTCPCKKCRESPHLAKTQWGEFLVRTACHVVYDNSEAEHTRCDLFFDSDDNYNYPSLEGVEVMGSNTDGDCCFMHSITHDEDVYNKLYKLLDCVWKLRDEVKQTYQKRSPKHMNVKKTVVVISHPHGLCKHVTVGEITYTPAFFEFWESSKYSAETCPGSSGGHVCVLGDWDNEFMPNVTWSTSHSACKQKGHNESTIDIVGIKGAKYI